MRREPRRHQIRLQHQACHPTLEPNTLASSHFHINHIPSKTSQFDFLMFPNFSALQQNCQWFNQNVVLIDGEGKLIRSLHLTCCKMGGAGEGGLVVPGPWESHKRWPLSQTDTGTLTRFLQLCCLVSWGLFPSICRVRDVSYRIKEKTKIKKMGVGRKLRYLIGIPNIFPKMLPIFCSPFCGN